MHFDHEAGLGQLLFQSSFLCFQVADPLLLPVTRRPAPRLGQTGQRPHVTGPAPLHNVTGVQALTAQHRTLTSGSWLNMVEIFFGIITRQAIRRGTFQSVPDLKAAIRSFIDGWNERCEPFVWTKDTETILAKAKRKTTTNT